MHAFVVKRDWRWNNKIGLVGPMLVVCVPRVMIHGDSWGHLCSIVGDEILECVVCV